MNNETKSVESVKCVLHIITITHEYRKNIKVRKKNATPVDFVSLALDEWAYIAFCFAKRSLNSCFGRRGSEVERNVSFVSLVCSSTNFHLVYGFVCITFAISLNQIHVYDAYTLWVYVCAPPRIDFYTFVMCSNFSPRFFNDNLKTE